MVWVLLTFVNTVYTSVQLYPFIQVSGCISYRVKILTRIQESILAKILASIITKLLLLTLVKENGTMYM